MANQAEQTEALLAEFDKRRTWPGLSYYAKTYGKTRAGVSWILLKARRARYLAMRRPHGKRNDLIGRGKEG